MGVGWVGVRDCAWMDVCVVYVCERGSVGDGAYALRGVSVVGNQYFRRSNGSVNLWAA